MASIGDLVIRVGGDVSGFRDSMQEASAAADKFTNKITSSISQGVTLFDAYGRSVQSAAAPTAELANANDKLAAAAFNAANGMVLAGEAAEKAASSHGHAITEIQAVSGSLRTLESNGGIRAAERFLTMIPGLAGALQIGFPLVGAVAFSEVLARIFEKIDPLAEAEKHLEEVNKQVDQSFEQIATRIESIHVQEITGDFGKLQGLKLQGFYDADAAARDRDNIKALEAQMATLQRQIESTRTLPQFFSNPLRAFNPLEIGMQAGQMMDARANDRNVQAIQSQIEEAQFRLRQFEAQDRLNKKQQDKAAADEALEASRKQHDALRQADEDALALEKSQHQMSVGETIQFWQKRQAAESGNVDRVREINITLGNLYQERDKMLARVVEHGAKLMDEQAKKAEEWAAKMEGLAVDAQKLIDSSVKQLGERTTKLNDIGIQSNAQGQEGAAEFKKLDAEKEFAGLAFQTESRRVALLQREAAINQEILEAKIAALALEQQNEEDPVKKAELGLQLQRSIIEAGKQREQTEIRITEEKRRQSLADQLADSAMRIPGALGNSLAHGIMSGKNIGQDIAQSLRGIGQQMMGNVFNRLIVVIGNEIASHVSLIGALAAHMGITTAHVAATTANTISTGVNTAATGVNSATGLTNTVATTANTVATSVQTAMSAAGGFLGGFGGLIGGLGGGLISGLMTMAGDDKIVKAINGTTSAVLSLRGGLGIGGSDKKDANSAALTSGNGNGGGGLGFGGFMQGVLGLGDSNAIPVRIVQSWGDIIHQGLFGALGAIFGFADGGDPPLGRPSWVGERGPELFIPKTAGTIIPNHALRSFASTGTLSVAGNNGHTFNGDLHFHGVQNVRDMMRQIASVAKTASPQFSPAASR